MCIDLSEVTTVYGKDQANLYLERGWKLVSCQIVQVPEYGEDGKTLVRYLTQPAYTMGKPREEEPKPETAAEVVSSIAKQPLSPVPSVGPEAIPHVDFPPPANVLQRQRDAKKTLV